jgi:hypothetical protein
VVASSKTQCTFATRPKERVFFNPTELADHVRERSKSIRVVKAPLQKVRLRADGNTLQLRAPGLSLPAELTHLAASQLCQRVNLSKRFLAQVSPRTAALAINESLGNVRARDLNLRVDGKQRLHSVVSPHYVPVDDAAIMERIGQPLTQEGWMVPPKSAYANRPRARPALAHEVLPSDSKHWMVREGDWIQPAGARSSDRFLHLFLVHPERVVDTADIMDRKLLRGIKIRHSESGEGSLAIDGFLFDTICGNYMMMGSRRVFRIRMAHKGFESVNAMVDLAVRRLEVCRRMQMERAGALAWMAKKAAKVLLSEDDRSRTVEIEQMLAGARIKGIFSRSFIHRAHCHGRGGKYGDQRSLWSVVCCLTEEAQVKVQYAEQREVYDQAAAQLLEWGISA